MTPALMDLDESRIGAPWHLYASSSWKKAGSLHVTKWSQKDLWRIQRYRNGLTKSRNPL